MENSNSSASFTGKENEKKHKNRPSTSKGLFKRPSPDTTGIINWLTTVDHKKVSVIYGLMAMICLIFGGIEVFLIRTHLAQPESTALTAQDFTMHGTTLVYLLVIPLSTAFFNFVVPLQIGARNVAFPRINIFSLWCFLAGLIILNMRWLFTGDAPVIGWSGYSPISFEVSDGVQGISMDFWIMGLLLMSLATILTSFNFITTIINMRCPGMRMMRLPVFSWMTLITSFLLIHALPPINIALVELLLDRQFGTQFYHTTEGGNGILWQHLFWIFAHPEVYLLILPTMGIISEILPTFSKKPLWGYGWIVFSTVMIGFLGLSIWSHQMFLNMDGDFAVVTVSTLMILVAIPAGIQLFNWIATLLGGSRRYTTPMLFAVGFLILFIVGGLTGFVQSITAIDAQQSKTGLSITHFHYVLLGGSIFGFFAGFYYWIPKLTGAVMSEKFGKFCFILIFTGFNLTFFPTEYLDQEGLLCRAHTFLAEKGWNDPNLPTIGAFVLVLGILFSTFQIIYTVRNSQKLPKAGNDPWDARTLEWITSSPVPVYNFPRTPIVKTRDQFWEDKYGDLDCKIEFEPEIPQGVRMRDPSWCPLFASLGIFILGFGMIARKMVVNLPSREIWEPNVELCIIGLTITLMSILFWTIEGPGGYFLEQNIDLDAEEE